MHKQDQVLNNKHFHIVCRYVTQCYIIIIIIIILSYHQHGYPEPSLATPPYRSSLPAGPLNHTLYSSWLPCVCSAM